MPSSQHIALGGWPSSSISRAARSAGVRRRARTPFASLAADAARTFAALSLSRLPVRAHRFGTHAGQPGPITTVSCRRTTGLSKWSRGLTATRRNFRSPGPEITRPNCRRLPAADLARTVRRSFCRRSLTFIRTIVRTSARVPSPARSARRLLCADSGLTCDRVSLARALPLLARVHLRALSTWRSSRRRISSRRARHAAKRATCPFSCRPAALCARLRPHRHGSRRSSE